MSGRVSRHEGTKLYEREKTTAIGYALLICLNGDKQLDTLRDCRIAFNNAFRIAPRFGASFMETEIAAGARLLFKMAQRRV